MTIGKEEVFIIKIITSDNKPQGGAGLEQTRRCLPQMMASKKTKNARIRPRRLCETESPSRQLAMFSRCDYFYPDANQERTKRISPLETRSQPSYKRKRRLSATPTRNNNCYKSWQRILLLVIIFETIFLSSVSAVEFLQVDSSGDIVKQSARRERIARNLQSLSEDQHQNDSTLNYVYRVRPRIDISRNEKIENNNNEDQRKLQREWIDPDLLPNAFSSSEDEPTSFSAGPPNPMPSGFSDDRRTRKPTPRPTRGPISLPPHILPPIFVRPEPTPRPTARPTDIPTAPEPAPVQEPPGGGDPVDPPEPGGGGEPVDPPEPSGGNPVDPPGPGDEPNGPVSEPGGGNEPGSPSGGGGNEPGTPSGNEPGGGGNEPGTPSANEPGDGGNEPGTPSGNEPGGGNIQPGESSSTPIPAQIPTVADEPGEPSGGAPGGSEPGNQPGEPNSGNNEPGGNQPGEPNNGGNNNEPAEAPVRIPSDGGSTPGEPGGTGEAGDPVTVSGQTIQEKPVTMTIAALNTADNYAISSLSGNVEENSTYPTQEPTTYAYTTGSPEWSKERIIVAEVPPLELLFAVFSGKKNLQPSLEDKNVLEILTSEHMLKFSNAMIGSNLWAVDGLALRNIIVTGEVRKPSRKLSQVFEDPRIGARTNWFELEEQEQTFVFTFSAKFIFMHWTDIAWALDLDGLSKNLVVASLEGDEKDNYLTTLQTMSSFNRTNGKTKDFLFASTRDMILAPSQEIEGQIKVEEIDTPFVKPEFPTLSALAFICLGLAIVMCLLHWRIESKRQRWLKNGTKYEDDDEITLSFSDTNEEAMLFTGSQKEPKPQRRLKPSKNPLQRSDKTLKNRRTRETNDEVTVVFSDSSSDDECDEYSSEISEANESNRSIKWGLDYIIYNNEEKMKKEKTYSGKKEGKRNDADADNYQSDVNYEVDLPKNSNRETVLLVTPSSVASMSDMSTNDAPIRSRDDTSMVFPPPVMRRKPYSVLKDPEPKILSARGDVWTDRLMTHKESKMQRKQVDTRIQSHHLTNDFPSTHSKESKNVSKNVSNPFLGSKQDTSRKSLRNLVARRQGMEKATQHTSNMTLDKHGVFTARRGALEEGTKHASNSTANGGNSKSMKCGYFF